MLLRHLFVLIKASKIVPYTIVLLAVGFRVVPVRAMSASTFATVATF